MCCRIVDGKAIASQIRKEVAEEVKEFVENYSRAPVLHVMLANDDPASRIYVNQKRKACAEVGIESWLWDWEQENPENRRPEDFVSALLDRVHKNDFPTNDAIIIQLPICGCCDPKPIYDKIPPLKDVDALSPENMGLLLQGRPRFRSCTPAGIIELLIRSNHEVRGKHITIINNSDIVGKPLSALLAHLGATVSVCHRYSKTEDIKRLCRQSEVVVVAVGIPGFLDASYVSRGATVVDVGTTRVEGKVVGDVNFSEVRKIAGAITRVPGGVGPCTCAMVLRNTLEAAKLQI